MAIKPYLVSTIFVVVAYGLKLLTPYQIISEIPFLLFFSAVVLSGIYGGFRVGLYATGLSAAISYYCFLPPMMTFAKGDWYQDFKIGLYIIDCVTMAAICGKLKNSQMEADRGRREADELNIRLEKAVKVRDEFLSIASHEMKTPLTSLKLQSQLFLRNIDKNSAEPVASDKVHRFASQTNVMIGNLNRLIDDMLDVSRLRSGNLSLVLAPCDFSELVKNCLERESLSFIQAARPLPKLELPTSMPITADCLRLEQVLVNLLSNALRYGGPEQVSIKLVKVDGLARLTVEDHGEGIPGEKLILIFERYERARELDGSKGLGLGLFISQQIIMAHKGRIWAESQVGQGTKFIVEIPV